jgi:hypothetical protein
VDQSRVAQVARDRQQWNRLCHEEVAVSEALPQQVGLDGGSSILRGGRRIGRTGGRSLLPRSAAGRANRRRYFSTVLIGDVFH